MYREANFKITTLWRDAGYMLENMARGDSVTVWVREVLQVDALETQSYYRLDYSCVTTSWPVSKVNGVWSTPIKLDEAETGSMVAR